MSLILFADIQIISTYLAFRIRFSAPRTGFDWLFIQRFLLCFVFIPRFNYIVLRLIHLCTLLFAYIKLRE